MLQHVLPADIDDERYLRVKCRDVIEALLGADSKEHTVGLRGALELGHDVRKICFVRKKVV